MESAQSEDGPRPAKPPLSTWRVVNIWFTAFAVTYFGWVVYDDIVRPRIDAAKHAKSHALMESYVAVLKAHREAHGSYPASLDDVRRNLPIADGWGNPLRYKTDCSHFVLASLGKDGKPDLFDAPHLEVMEKPFDLIDLCDHPHADEVVTDKTWVTRCR